MDKVEKNKKISFIAIAVSFIFLFNPSISIVDIFPDFLGYIIITLALTKLADLNDTFFEAQRKFKFLILVDVFKLFALFWSFGMASGNERSSSLLLWVFVFAVLDFVFVIPAFLKLFAGMTELGFTHDNSYVLKPNGKRGKNNTDKIRRLTVIFIAFKAIATLLPELTELTASYYKDLEISSSRVSLYGYVGALRFFAIAVIFVFGTAWLVKIIRYFIKVNKDTDFIISLNNAYSERVLPKKGLFIKRRVNVAGYLTAAAIVASLDIRFDGVNLIPDILVVPLAAAALVLLARTVKLSRTKTVALCAASGAVFIAHNAAEYIFLAKFYDKGIEIIWRSEEAMLWYALTVAFAVASAIMLILLFGFIFKAYLSVIDMTAEVDGIDDRNIVFLRGYAEETKKTLNRRLLICFIFLCVYALTDICYAVFSKAFGAMFLINVLGAVVFFAVFLSFFAMLGSAMKDKYKLE